MPSIITVERTIYPKGNHLVYKATFPSGKLYFGITKKSLKDRISSHYSQARYDSKKGKRLGLMQNALLKYPKESVKWEVLAMDLHSDFAKALEKSFISIYETFKKRGYNLTLGGDSSPIPDWSLEDRKKRAEILGTLPFCAAKIDSLEIVGQWNCIVQAAEELRVDQSLISRCLAGKTISHKGFIFCKLEDVHKLPELQKRSQVNRKRKFEVIDIEGNLVGIWDNSNQCARDLNLPTPREIRAVLTNPKRSSYKSYRFRFV